MSGHDEALAGRKPFNDLHPVALDDAEPHGARPGDAVLLHENDAFAALVLDGEKRHRQGAFDLSYLRCIPNMVVMAPADENECRQMLYTALTLEQPAAVRYPRGQGPGVRQAKEMRALPVGRAKVRRQGTGELAILVFGTLLASCEDVAERLDATLVNMRFVKPLDERLVLDLAHRVSAFVTVEENVIAGGAGSAVNELLAAHGVQRPVLNIGIPDRFIEHGSRKDCLVAAGLDRAGIEAAILRWHARPPVPAAASSA